jgi:4-amino-4-deoxy-L-arabinose transferase-like glycosyltransferase
LNLLITGIYRLQKLDSKGVTAKYYKTNYLSGKMTALSAQRQTKRSPARTQGFSLISLLLLLYALEGNYYANYFFGGSGWWDVG